MNLFPFFKQEKKLIRSVCIVGLVLLFVISFTWLAYWMPIKGIESKPFFEDKTEGPLVIAHRGGQSLAPANTIVAFQNAVDMGVDAIETDIHITKDGHLVTIHDPTVNNTTDGQGKVAEYTLEELQKLDAGYYYRSKSGEHSFRGKGVYIPTLEEVFHSFPNMKFNIEIKYDNPPHRIKEIVTKLYSLIEEYNMEENILIFSFDQKIIDSFRKYSHGKIAIQGGTKEVEKFMFLHSLFLRNLYKPNADGFQLPLKVEGYDLSTKKVIDNAHRQGLQVHYWTINDRKTMKELIKKGADGIITDRPDLLIELLRKMGIDRNN
jgi:glycerophosphoryl diester phosphodiesterase